MTNFSENLNASLPNADLLNEPTFRKERKYLAIVALSADRGQGKGVEPIVTVARKSFFFGYFFGGLECVGLGHSFAYVAHL
jgi:hypothetical protein